MNTCFTKALHNKEFIILLALAALMILVAVFAGNFSPHDPYELHYDHILESESLDFPLGTDNMGRCILSRLMYGGRTSLLIVFLVVAIIATMGITTGIVSGFSGGVLDSILMRLCDMMMAFPSTVFVIALVSILGTSLQNMIIAMTAIGWVHYARVSRSLVLSIKHKDYIEMARLGGAGEAKIMLQYIAPNVLPYLIVMITQDIGGKLLSLAGYSLLGLGSQPPTPEWGFMLSEGKNYMQTAPWMLVYPGLVILFNVIIFNLLGDRLRDILDPKSELSDHSQWDLN